MLLKTRGILFRAIKYGETSLIIDVYTEEQGLKKYIVSGVRTQRAKMHANLFQVMSIIDLVAYNRKDKELNRLKEVQPSYIYQQLPFQVQRSAVGMFLIEVARKSIPESEPNPELFLWMYRFLQHIDQSPQTLANIPSFFLIQLSAFLGFTPSLEQASPGAYFDLKEGNYVPVAPIHQNYLDPTEAKYLSDLIQTDLEQLAKLNIPKKNREQLLKGLLDYFSLHLDHFSTIHSHKILKTVLE